MNRIVRAHYPVSQLPEELQREFPGQVEVTLTVEAKAETAIDGTLEDPAPPYGRGHSSRFRHVAKPRYRSSEEIVAHVRTVRDEWDEQDRLLTVKPDE